MVKNLSFAVVGLALTLHLWDLQPELPLRFAALTLPLTWLGGNLFYAIPLIVSYLPARLCCRWREGAWLVTGSVVALIGILTQCSETYLSFPLFAACGTGRAFWLASTAVLPSLIGKALALNGYRRSPAPRSLDRDLATWLRKLRTPAGATALTVLTASTGTWLYLTRAVPPQLTPDDLRYTLGGICAGMTRTQIEARIGAGIPQPPTGRNQDSTTFEYPRGRLSYTEHGWVGLAYGAPLHESGVVVASEGDSSEQVIRALGPPARSEHSEWTLRLIWPRYSLSIQFLDDKLQHCTLHLRQ